MADLSADRLAELQRLSEWYEAKHANDHEWLTKYDDDKIYRMAALLPSAVAELSRLRAEHNQQAADDHAMKVAAFSRWLESTPSYQGISPEAVVWRRCMKVGEEFGEVVEALLGMLGENPRKGVTGCADEAVHELLDTAVAALGAVEHFNGHSGDCFQQLRDHIDFVCERVGVSVAALVPVQHPTEEKQQ